MKYAAAILFFAATAAGAAPFFGMTGFNQDGFTTIQSASVSGRDGAQVVFMTPPAGPQRYLIQVGNAPGGLLTQYIIHNAILVDPSGNVVAHQVGPYPSFYVVVGRDLAPNTDYLLMIYNDDAAWNPTCPAGHICNVTVLIQQAN